MSVWTNIYSTVQLCSFGRYWEASVLVTLAAVAVTVVVILVIDRHQRTVRRGCSCAGSRCAGLCRTPSHQSSGTWVISWMYRRNIIIQGGRNILQQARRSGSGKGCFTAKCGVVMPKL